MNQIIRVLTIECQNIESGSSYAVFCQPDDCISPMPSQSWNDR